MVIYRKLNFIYIIILYSYLIILEVNRLGGRKRSMIRIDDGRKKSVTYIVNNMEDILLDAIQK